LLQPETPTPNEAPQAAPLLTKEEILAKYGDVDNVMKAFAHSQAHIQTLEQGASVGAAQQAETLAQLNKKSSTEDLIAQLRQAATDPNQGTGLPTDQPGSDTLTPPVNPMPNGDTTNMFSGNNDDNATSDKELYREVYQEERNKERADANKRKSSELLKENYGDTASRALQEAIAKSSLTTEMVEQLATTSPEALLSLVKGAVGSPEGFKAASPAALNSQAMPLVDQANGGGPKTEWEKDKALMKADYALYYSADVAEARRKRIDSMGPEAYYGTDGSSK